MPSSAAQLLPLVGRNGCLWLTLGGGVGRLLGLDAVSQLLALEDVGVHLRGVAGVEQVHGPSLLPPPTPRFRTLSTGSWSRVGRLIGIPVVFLPLGLSKAGLVQFLEVDHPPGFSGNHGHNVHGRAPYGGFDLLFVLDGAHGGVLVKALSGLLLLVDRYWSVLVDGEGCNLGVDKQLACSTLQGLQLLPLAAIEG